MTPSDVDRLTTIQIAFSEAMDESTLTKANIQFTGSFQAALPDYTIDYNAQTYTVTLTLDGELSRLRGYFVNVSTDVKDAQGNPLPQAFSSRFATEDGSWQPAQAIPEAQISSSMQDVAMASADDGSAMIVYGDGVDLFSSYYHPENGWQGRKSVGDFINFHNSDASVRAYGSGYIAAWSATRAASPGSGETQIMTNRSTGANWGTNTAVSLNADTSLGDATDPQIGISGNPVVVYRQRDLTGNRGRGLRQNRRQWRWILLGDDLRYPERPQFRNRRYYYRLLRRPLPGNFSGATLKKTLLVSYASNNGSTWTAPLSLFVNEEIDPDGMSASSGYQRTYVAWTADDGRAISYAGTFDFGTPFGPFSLNTFNAGMDGIAKPNVAMGRERSEVFITWNNVGTPKAKLTGNCNTEVVDLGGSDGVRVAPVLAMEPASFCHRAAAAWKTTSGEIKVRRWNGYAYTPYGDDDPDRNEWLATQTLDVPYSDAIPLQMTYLENGDILLVGSYYDSQSNKYKYWSSLWH